MMDRTAPPPQPDWEQSADIPAVRLTGIEKRFGAVHANRAASLEVRRGEIHALVGENGAGKSTLMRILSGMHRSDAGTVEVDGRDVTGWSTAEAITAGVGMVHQHFMLVPTLTVAENVVLGREPVRAGTFDHHRAVQEVESLSERTGLRVTADRLVADLSVGEAQRVEILKTLYRGARILLLDEPTAVLSPPEVTELWNVLRTLRDGGATIILITHKLEEVMAVTDRITVMRQGATVERLLTRETTPAAIARSMVGRDIALMTAGVAAPGVVTATSTASAASAASRISAGGAPVLEVHDLVVRGARVDRAVDGVSFSIAPGEILGIAGVEGNGQTELLEALAGLRPVTDGSIRLGGIELTPLDVRARGDAGLSHIPEDRHRRGLILEYPVADNLVLGRQHRFSAGRFGWLDRRAIADNARARIAEYDIRPPDPAAPARALSGGNQQKVVIAREMSRDFSVLLAAQPTRGVDVGAIEFIHAELRRARDDGKAILLVSAELREVLALSDRIAVMFDGRIVTIIPRAQASEDVLGPWMMGVHGGAVA
ncbi:MAG TPA: ABC transporter ATP-binding protein [Gemmatimonadaceae bacterium]|nr:ABC transporter ATP-binding protein [Gemmatimonadaceae bacterium]